MVLDLLERFVMPCKENPLELSVVSRAKLVTDEFADLSPRNAKLHMAPNPFSEPSYKALKKGRTWVLSESSSNRVVFSGGIPAMCQRLRMGNNGGNAYPRAILF